MTEPSTTTPPARRVTTSPRANTPAPAQAATTPNNNGKASATNPTPATPGNEPPAPTDPADDFANERDRRRFAELSATLHEREVERDRALERLTAAQWREIERYASALLSIGADVRLEHPDVDAYLDDAGSVDPAKVQAVATALVAKRPGMVAAHVPRPLPGAHGMAPAAAKPTLGDVLRRVSERQ